MKHKLLWIIVNVIGISLLLISETYAEEYIVKLSDVGLYSTDDVSAIQHNYCIAHNEIELQKYIDNYMVEYYEPNYDVELFANPQDENCSEQWYLEMLNTQSAWNLETYGNDIRIAVIDSGCYRHDDIIANLADGYNYIDDSNDTSDTVGHGTAVSGIIASEMNEIGIAGIASKAGIVALKCFDSGVSTKVSTIINAMYDAVDKYDCSIINMSWGLSNNSQSLQDAVSYAEQHGVIMVAAVGNSGSDTLAYPAAYDEVIGVGSVDCNEVYSDFSRYNESVFVTAPGENILTLDIHNSYSEQSGTSFSAPMVTALTAILLNVNENLTASDLKVCLSETATDLGDSGYDIYY